jgi:YVTN family beta-propeller protein
MNRYCIVALIALTSCHTATHPRGLEEALQAGPDAFLEKAVVGPQNDGTYVVATSQRIDPAGETVLIPGRPVDVAAHPTESLVAVKGKTDLVFIDSSDRTVVQSLKLPGAGNSFVGLAWSGDGSTVWVTDASQHLHAATRTNDRAFAWSRSIELPGPEGNPGRRGKSHSTPGGIAVDIESGLAYVTLSRKNTLGVVDLNTGKLIDEIEVGIAPFTVVLAGDKAYVSNWGGRRPRSDDFTGPTSGSEIVVDPDTGIASSGTVSVINLQQRETVAELEVGLHPSGFALSPDASRLYVANANSDTVSVIDTRRNMVADTIGVKPMAELPFGSAPNALAVSRDGNTLYVALGGNNALAVYDLKKHVMRGLIPTGWYPGAVTLIDGGKTLCIGNIKGVGGRDATRSLDKRGGWNSHDHLGSVSFVPVPDAKTLAKYTTQVGANMRLPNMVALMSQDSVPERVVPVPSQPGEVSPIKHVLYIIKENRTYDQVFGDLPQGNGDPELCMFGREVTPNQHALVEEFVLLDNFYCNGVLSADGHNWTNEGFVTDYLERSFGGFTRSYPYAGDDALAYASSGFIWDYVLAKGLSFRCYGEFVQAVIEPNDASWTDIYQDYLSGTRKVSIKATTKLHTLRPHLSPNFIGFPGKVQDVYRAQEFIEELEEYEKTGDLPNFMIMLLPNDHTVGTRPKYPTPRAQVADNDLAVGKIVEALSHSRFWPETAIFVVQDDPQAGVDHVDGRRTVAMCISPYTKRGIVDSTHYNQNSMLRTMELILGLPPMNQLDMAANPMFNCFTETPDFTPYTVRPNQIPLDEMNPDLKSLRGKQRYYAKKSLEMPLDDIDRADEGEFNRVIWHSVKGYDTPYPDLARRGEVGVKAWPGVRARVEDDD